MPCHDIPRRGTLEITPPAGPGGEWIVIYFPYLTGDPEKDQELHRPMITSHSRPDMPVDGGPDAIARWWEAEFLGYRIVVAPERDGFDAWAREVGRGPGDIWLAYAATEDEAADAGLEAIRRHDRGEAWPKQPGS